MAEYKGNSSKIVSSSYLFTQLQTLYTKIKGLIDKKSDKSHTHKYAGSSTAGGAATTALNCTGNSATATNADNASKLEGFTSSSFMLNYDNYGNVYFNSGDMNDWTRSGVYAIPSGIVNAPSARGEDTWGTILILNGLEGSRVSQMATFWNDQNRILWHRHKNSTSWSPWRKMQDALNSDTLDGYHATDFLMKKPVVVLPNGGADNQEGSEIELTNQDGSIWCIDSCANNFRVFQGDGTMHMIFRKNSANELYGTTYINGTLFANLLSSRYLDGSTTNGQDGNLYLNYNNYDNPIYFGNQGYGIANNGGFYNGTSGATFNLQSTGFGYGALTYYQTSSEFDGNSDWCHYLIANHGDGETYYHYTIGLPFWGSPIYKRQVGSKNETSGWQKFYTTENITMGTWGMTPGTTSLTSGNIYIQYE